MSIVELCIRTAATKAARPCRRIYPKGTQTFGRVPAFLRLFLFDAVKTNNLFLERNKNSNTCRSFLFRFAFRGARLSPILGRGDGAISLFCSAVRFFAPKRGAVGAKVVDAAEKWAVFGRKQWGFRPKSTAFFSPSGGRERPLRPSGRKAPARRAKWGCTAMLSRMGVHRRAHI